MSLLNSDVTITYSNIYGSSSPISGSFGQLARKNGPNSRAVNMKPAHIRIIPRHLRLNLFTR